MTDYRLAELAALEDFEWVIEDFEDIERTIAETHAAHAAEIAAKRAELAGNRDPAGVTFYVADGEPWAWTDLRSDGRRGA